MKLLLFVFAPRSQFRRSGHDTITACGRTPAERRKVFFRPQRPEVRAVRARVHSASFWFAKGSKASTRSQAGSRCGMGIGSSHQPLLNPHGGRASFVKHDRACDRKAKAAGARPARRDNRLRPRCSHRRGQKRWAERRSSYERAWRSRGESPGRRRREDLDPSRNFCFDLNDQTYAKPSSRRSSRAAAHRTRTILRRTFLIHSMTIRRLRRKDLLRHPLREHRTFISARAASLHTSHAHRAWEDASATTYVRGDCAPRIERRRSAARDRLSGLRVPPDGARRRREEGDRTRRGLRVAVYVLPPAGSVRAGGRTGPLCARARRLESCGCLAGEANENPLRKREHALRARPAPRVREICRGQGGPHAPRVIARRSRLRKNT